MNSRAIGAALLCLCCNSWAAIPLVLAEEQKEEDAPSILSSALDPAAAAKVRRVAILVYGSEDPERRVLQDAIGIELRKLGWEVIGRTELEQQVARDFREWAATVAGPEKDTKSNLPKETDERSIAKLVQADAYLTVTFLVGRHHYMTAQEKGTQAGVDKLAITGVSFHLVSVETGRPLFEAVIGYRYGKSAPFVAQEISKVLKSFLGKG